MNPPLSTIRGGRGRWLAERLILLAIAWIALRTWVGQGIVVRCPVVSGSMAEALLGLHREVTCADCGYSFPCGTDTALIRPTAVCPNCGCMANEVAELPDLSGDGVVVARSAFDLRPPRRWEVVAFRNPADSDQILVKRVAGLPGEGVQIRGGDLFIDDRLQRKSLSEQMAVAVLVHDANFAPTHTAGLPARWQGEGEASHWSSSAGRFSHPAGPVPNTLDWLTYHHWVRQGDDERRVRETPILDDSGYNQNISRRLEDYRAVGDVMAVFRVVEISGEGRLYLRANDGRDAFEVRIDPRAGTYETCRWGKPVPGGAGAFWPLAGGSQITVSLFDRQLLLAVDGQTLLMLPYEPSDRPQKPTSRPLAVAADGLGVVLDEVRVYRDVYYTRPTGLDARWGLDRPYRLAADEYFVLGDNSPVSSDSRTWPSGAGVDGKLLFGKPLAVLFSARRAIFLGGEFQVPDPRRIRYIR